MNTKSSLGAMKIAAIALAGVALAALTGCAVAPAHAMPAATVMPTATATAPTTVTVTETGDIRVTGSPTAPQTILTTATTTCSGAPVTIDFGVEYVNMIPDTSVGSNGIGFELYEDGIHIERLTLFGNHNSGLNQFGPVYVHIILDAAQTPTAGSHVFSVGAWKWAPNGDGYLRTGDVEGLFAQPMRLTVSQ